MELEELKAEADKMGYRVVKKKGSDVLLPCTCRARKLPEWLDLAILLVYMEELD